MHKTFKRSLFWPTFEIINETKFLSLKLVCFHTSDPLYSIVFINNWLTWGWNEITLILVNLG